MTVTIREVADAAGVSTATVSRALSGVQTVDPELVERVRRSAEHLGYRANRVARALRRQSTQTVGVIVPDITYPFFPLVIQAVERELRQGGLSLLLCDAGNDAATEAELVRNMLDHQVDGLLISACDRAASRPALEQAASRMPLLQIGRRITADLPYVGVDHAETMSQVVGHLTEAGCRSFGYIGLDAGATLAGERLEAFLGLVEPIDPAAAGRTYLGGHSIAWGREAAERVLDTGPPPDAIVCASDEAAVGALQALRERGVRVPDDVVLTGFGDTVLAEASEPQLTSVRQPLEEMGVQAVAALQAAIGSRQPPRSAVLKAVLVARDSTRKPAALA